MPKHGRGPGAPGRGTRGPREAPPLRDTDRGKGRSPASRTLSSSPFPPNLLSGRGRPVIQGAQVQTGRHPGVTPARRGGQCGIAGCPDTEGGLPFRKAKGTGHTDSPRPPPRGAGEQRGDRRTLVTLPHMEPSLSSMRRATRAAVAICPLWRGASTDRAPHTGGDSEKENVPRCLPG